MSGLGLVLMRAGNYEEAEEMRRRALELTKNVLGPEHPYTLLAQSILSGVFVGALYGLLGLGLSLSWGLLRLINLAHFAFAFLAAYLCYQMATMGLDPLLTLALIVPLFFVIGAGLHAAMARFEMTPFNSLLMTFGTYAIRG